MDGAQIAKRSGMRNASVRRRRPSLFGVSRFVWDI
jgi:hypothetical protein